jgi:rod shape-determining protein MreD
MAKDVLHPFRWWPFIILALVFLVCQTTFVWRMRIEGYEPNWMLILMIHYALWAPWPDAGLCAWVIGMLVDLQTHSTPLGPHSLCFGLVAWILAQFRNVLFRDHPLTHIFITFVFAFAVQFLLQLYWAWKVPELSRPEIAEAALYYSLYTAAWSPVILGVLIKLQGWTGLGPSRRRPAYRPEGPMA